MGALYVVVLQAAESHGRGERRGYRRFTHSRADVLREGRERLAGDPAGLANTVHLPWASRTSGALETAGDSRDGVFAFGAASARMSRIPAPVRYMAA